MGQKYEVDAVTGNEKVTGTLTVTGAINANGGVVGTLTGAAATLANTAAAGNSAIAAVSSATTGTIAIAQGGTGQATQQAALDAITNVAAASTNWVLSKVGTSATWQAVVATQADNATTVNNTHVSTTPTANYLLPLNASTKYPNSVLMTGAGNGLDADTLDTYQSTTTPSASKILVLDASAKFPNSALYTGSGNGLDADTVDGHNAPATDVVPTAGQILIVRSDGKYPAIDGSLITNLNIPTLPAMPYWLKATTITNANASLAVAANTANVTLSVSIPAGGCIHAVKIKHSTAFTATSLTALTVSVGNAGATSKYASAFDVMSAVSSTNYQLTNELFGEDHLAATPCVATFTSTGALLNALAAGTGAVDIWVMVSVAV